MALRSASAESFPITSSRAKTAASATSMHLNRRFVSVSRKTASYSRCQAGKREGGNGEQNLLSAIDRHVCERTLNKMQPNLI